jgi:hypothetical protein
MSQNEKRFLTWLAVMVTLVITLTVRGLTRDYCFVDYPPGPGHVGDMLNRCWP